MNLKEYYKEILNNLLMTETTASPQYRPVEPGSLRADRLAGLQRGFHKLPDTYRGLRRKERIESILKAKGADTSGGLNVYGFGDRQAAAKLSNIQRNGGGGAGVANDKRNIETKLKMRNAKMFDRRSKPGGDN